MAIYNESKYKRAKDSKLYKIMLSKFHTLSDFLERSKVPKGSFYSACEGKNIEKKTIEKISDALGVDPHEWMVASDNEIAESKGIYEKDTGYISKKVYEDLKTKWEEDRNNWEKDRNNWKNVFETMSAEINFLRELISPDERKSAFCG